MASVPVVIERRYNGPPDSGHGGWSAGQAALLTGAPVVEVTLRRPPPLERELAVVRHADREPPDRRTDASGGASAVEVVDGDEVVLAARPGALDVDGPPPVGLDAAADASARFAWLHDHPFPTCFGCGPARAPDDALRLFCGPVGDGRFAVPWTPPPWTGGETVDAAYLWAALDCPSSAPVHGSISAPVVLGRFTVALEAPVRVGAPHVIQAWPERSDGRKRHTAVALFDADGRRLACGRAVWVQLARPLGG